MNVIITKRRKAYNVIYAVEKEDGEVDKRFETFYDYEQAIKRKKQIEKGNTDQLSLKKTSLFIDFLNQYASVVIFNESSISNYEYTCSLINNYLSKVIHDEKIKDINMHKTKQIIHDLQNLSRPIRKNQKSNESICPSALAGSLRILIQSCDYLVELNLLKVNYFSEYRPSVSIKGKDSEEWNLSYWQSLIDNCTCDWMFVLLHLCFDSGLQLSEVRALTLDNLEHLSEGYITSDKTLKRLNKNVIEKLDPNIILQTYKKKGFNNTNTVVALLKKDNVDKITLHSQVIDLLMNWRKECIKFDDTCSTLFNYDKDNPYDDRVINNKFKKLLQDSALSDLTLVKLIKFGEKKNSDGISYRDIYYSNIVHPLKCKEPDIEDVRKHMNSRYSVKYKNKMNRDFKERTSDYLPKEDHTDVDALVELLKENPQVKNKLLNKLLGKE